MRPVRKEPFRPNQPSSALRSEAGEETEEEMYVTYDLEMKTRDGGKIVYPKVQRVYIAGNVQDWKIGQVRKRTGRRVNGVRIEYEQHRKPYRRRGYTAERGKTMYSVAATSVSSTVQRFAKVVEVPRRARNVHFYEDIKSLPKHYLEALEGIR